MEIRRAYKYRLYPTRGQAAKLEQVLDRCRELYNAALQERRDAYRMAGVTISYYAQKRELTGVKEVRPEYRQVGSQVLQDVIQRVEWAFAPSFAACGRARSPVIHASALGTATIASPTPRQAGSSRTTDVWC